ncbi:zinc finger protein 211-like isoform X1 [Pleurodeles waltl]
MKTKEDVFQQTSGKVTFEDVAACFSEEEWRLLYEWQKELYTNVMKEIHQALTLLGPMIATSVFSLRAKGKEQLISCNHQETERKHRTNYSISAETSHPDVGKKSKEKKQCLKDLQDVDLRESTTHQTTGLSSVGTGIISKREHEQEDIFMDDQDSRSDERSIGLHSEHETIEAAVSFELNKEEENHGLGLRCFERRENKRLPAVAQTLPSIDQQRKGSRVNNATSMSSEHGRRCSYKADVNSHPRIKEEEALNACVGYRSGMTQGSSSVAAKQEHRPDTKTEYGKSSKDLAHKEMDTELEMYICSQCGNCFSRSLSNSEHLRTSKGERQTICSECQKKFLESTNLHKEQEKYVAGRPYICRECGKNFRKSQSLIIHQRVHTGEKPYTCSQCGKDFRQLPHLVKHQRLHTGEKPYVCNVCERRFIDSSNLKRHEQIHIRELESVTWATEG